MLRIAQHDIAMRLRVLRHSLRWESTEVRVPLSATTTHEGKRCALKTHDSDMGFVKQFDLNNCQIRRSQVLGEEIANERAVAKRHVVADMIAAFE